MGLFKKLFGKKRPDATLQKSDPDETVKVNQEDRIPQIDQLISAAGSGDTESVIHLLDQGVDINARDSSWGRTPLISSAAYNFSNTAKVLLDRGADPSVADNNGFTPLDVAVMNENMEVAAIIWQSGGRSGEGRSVEKRVIEMLEKHGVSVDIVDANRSDLDATTQDSATTRDRLEAELEKWWSATSEHGKAVFSAVTTIDPDCLPVLKDIANDPTVHAYTRRAALICGKEFGDANYVHFLLGFIAVKDPGAILIASQSGDAKAEEQRILFEAAFYLLRDMGYQIRP